jgi:hypothetical protein
VFVLPRDEIAKGGDVNQAPKVAGDCGEGARSEVVDDALILVEAFKRFHIPACSGF